MSDDGLYTISGLKWVCRDENGISIVDSIDLDNPVLPQNIASIHCLPTAVIAVGDILYQAFMLEKQNMGGIH